MSKVLYVANKGGRINGWGVSASTTHLVFGPEGWTSHGDDNALCGAHPSQHWVGIKRVSEHQIDFEQLCPRCRHKLDYLQIETNICWQISVAHIESPGDECTYEEGRETWKAIMGRRPMPKWLKEGVPRHDE